MSRILHAAAERELAEAFSFYSDHGGPDLAAAFLAEFERVTMLLVRNPGYGTPASGPRRIYPLRRFPYSVIYRESAEDFMFLRFHISVASRITGAAGTNP